MSDYQQHNDTLVYDRRRFQYPAHVVPFFTAPGDFSRPSNGETVVNRDATLQYQTYAEPVFFDDIANPVTEVLIGIASELDRVFPISPTGVVEEKMPKFGNRIKETSDTVGTGTLDLNGAPTGFRSFLTDFVSGDTVYYVIIDDPVSPQEYEAGIGTITSGTPNTLSRDTVEASSNSDNKVSFVAGTKTVINLPTAEFFNILVKAKTSSYTVLLSDYADLITCDASAVSPAAITVTLPTLATAREGFIVRIKNVGASGTVTVTGNGAETIDGLANFSLANQYDHVEVMSTTSEWLVSGGNTNITGGIPTGTVSPWAGNDEGEISEGWLICAGQEVSRSTYSALFTIVDTTYGVGDGSTTFNLPDLRGRLTAGKDDMNASSPTAGRITSGGSGIDGTVLGDTGGSETHTLNVSEMPAHEHASGSNVSVASGDTGPVTVRSNNATGNDGETVGGGGAHQNMPPSIILNYIIKT